MSRNRGFLRIAICVAIGICNWYVHGQPQLDVEDERILEYFSADYKEAREKFINAAIAAGIEVETVSNPEAGPNGEHLTTDVVHLGNSNADTVIVLVSGTHGVEGFAGSAIQVGLLREGVASKLKDNLSIIMIHSLNPYGFSHLRRVNEDNIDINRNFLDHTKPHPNNDGYVGLAEFVAPKIIDFWTRIFLWPQLIWYVVSGQTKVL